MVIEIRKSHAGNTALETDRFELPLAVAKEVAKMLYTPGGYWWFLKSAIRRAVREKQTTVKVFTAGFGSQKLCTILWQLGHTSNCTIYTGDIE